MIRDKKADITEVFSSIQGEGIFLGAKQIFVRFKECNINCIFCDELKKLSPKAYSPLQLMNEVRSLEKSKGAHHSVSLTGGEPLLYVGFLKEFLKLLKKEHFKSYLETNGILPKELAEVIEMIDIIAMDFKLPSSTGEKAYWKEHRQFLSIAMRKKVFVKAVVTQNTTYEDIEKAIRLMRRINEKVPFILQPATPVKSGDKMVANKRLLEFLDIASRNYLENIRVIPQIHKMLNVK